MKRLVSCEYNFDNCCVELKFTGGSMISIDTIAVENEVIFAGYKAFHRVLPPKLYCLEVM